MNGEKKLLILTQCILLFMYLINIVFICVFGCDLYNNICGWVSAIMLLVCNTYLNIRLLNLNEDNKNLHKKLNNGSCFLIEKSVLPTEIPIIIPTERRDHQIESLKIRWDELKNYIDSQYKYKTIYHGDVDAVIVDIKNKIHELENKI